MYCCSYGREVMVWQYVSVASWCLQMWRIHACNSKFVVCRCLIYIFFIVYVPEIIILVAAYFCYVCSMASVACEFINSAFVMFCSFRLCLALYVLRQCVCVPYDCACVCVFE
jgi:hypothetical protein